MVGKLAEICQLSALKVNVKKSISSIRRGDPSSCTPTRRDGRRSRPVMPQAFTIHRLEWIQLCTMLCTIWLHHHGIGWILESQMGRWLGRLRLSRTNKEGVKIALLPFIFTMSPFHRDFTLYVSFGSNELFKSSIGTSYTRKKKKAGT